MTRILQARACRQNVWLGVSVEDHKHGVPRIDCSRRSMRTIRFLSIEPLSKISASWTCTASIGSSSAASPAPCDDRCAPSGCQRAPLSAWTPQAPLSSSSSSGVPGESTGASAPRRRTAASSRGRTWDGYPAGAARARLEQLPLPFHVGCRRPKTCAPARASPPTAANTAAGYLLPVISYSSRWKATPPDWRPDPARTERPAVVALAELGRWKPCSASRARTRRCRFLRRRVADEVALQVHLAHMDQHIDPRQLRQSN